MLNFCKVFILTTLLMVVGCDTVSDFGFFGETSLADGSRYAFVASATNPSVIAVDTENNEVVATLEVPHVSGPIVVSEGLNQLFLTDLENKQVTVIDLKSREIAKVLDIGIRADAALLHPDDRYVAFGSKEGQVSIWDMVLFEQVLYLEGLESAENITFGFDGNSLYVVEQKNKRISVIGMKEGKKVTEIGLGGSFDADAEISAISRSADGATGFVSVTSENRVKVIDLINWKVSQSIVVSGSPVRPFSPADKRYILIPHRSGKAVTVLSALSYEVIATIATGIEARGMNTGWLDTVAFVMPETGNKIAIVDLANLEFSGTIELPGHPDDGLVTSDSRMLFTAMMDSGSIAAIDARDRELTTVIETPEKHLSGIQIGLDNNICH